MRAQRASSSLPYVLLWCRAVMVGVFLVSAVTKLSGRAALAAFVSWVASLRLPRTWSRPVAYAGAAAELGARWQPLRPAIPSAPSPRWWAPPS
jgi:uncharacterized membrane protein YphA (DoxX/SURF4 family)